MTKHSRRSFLKASGGILTVGAIGGLTMSCRKEPKPAEGKWRGFDYAMCNESMMDLPFAEQCKIVGAAGYTGIEIAPFTIDQDARQITAAQRTATREEVTHERPQESPHRGWATSPSSTPRSLRMVTFVPGAGGGSKRC